MQEQHSSQIYKYIPELVTKCNLRKVSDDLGEQFYSFKQMVGGIKFVNGDDQHNNRMIIFKLLKQESPGIFDEFLKILRKHKYETVADKLENKPAKSYMHKTNCFQKPDDITWGHINRVASQDPLFIEVTYATTFLDVHEANKPECYRTRSKNRGMVLIINNIEFEGGHDPRQGAMVDESNLKTLFEKMGFSVEMYRNLKKEEMLRATDDFATRQVEEPKPDICFFIIMSHGRRIENKTCVLARDGHYVEEDEFREKFSNGNCSIFRGKPKILIFHYCRGELTDYLGEYKSAAKTESDSWMDKEPDKPPQILRHYSDLMICHPSVDGFKAHRDTERGSWYIELICKTFMERAHELEVEAMLKLVEQDLQYRISEYCTGQTSTYSNVAFKTCYLNPGIYEEDGQIKFFKQSL